MSKKEQKEIKAEWLAKCAGKVKHLSYLSAEVTLEMTNDLTKAIYECKFCNNYHIGTHRKTIKRKKTKKNSYLKKIKSRRTKKSDQYGGK